MDLKISQSKLDQAKRGICGACRILGLSIIVIAIMMSAPVSSPAAIIFSIGIAPPPLPVYVQPACPGDGYIWTPGYWAYGDDGYFWVPGTWVLAPEPGYLWTPGYWGWNGSLFVFHQGYWGLHVGFYGGVNYGFGYFGAGYEGGYWNKGAFFYNRAVNNVTNVRNVYNKTVVINNNTTVNNVSYNGGQGGTAARPTAQEEEFAHERHIDPTPAQTQNVQTAGTNRQLYESTNHGRPPIAATPRPAQFSGNGVVAANAAAISSKPPTTRGDGSAEAAARTPETNTAEHAREPIHPSDLPAAQRPALPNTGNAKLDEKYEKQQEKLLAKQQQENEKLQRQQDQEHQRLAKQNANEAAKQQLEQKHQQETQHLAQQHAQEQERLQERQRPPTNRAQARPPR